LLKILSGGNGFSLKLYFEKYLTDGYKLLNHITQVTGNGIWVSFANIKTKGQSKQWIVDPQKIPPKKLKSSNKYYLPNSFLGQERSTDGRIHIKGHTSQVYRETKTA
jgi:hypothetical protein